ncbi:MAG: nucleoside triphosphate pyrophosphohydrolase, partial [Gemmatimonadetes bacterium]|nr:nucleoside triphosphate pyrophosphohydrolase [Gemmatimonadota bacterium]NIQ58749.1 nucleoside triphosphate pyrophosphohydrolase [Gemmatimonadota bacterium]NIU79168.1 nucleoside triphosphate pyrophosphohydrolase [Gammaproteobacteria bacterium]NIX47695.1 nucleoside triphosphate pyrophosphohydrolase [Gemmatimonadota bacterium]
LRANAKFVERFGQVERLAAERGIVLGEASLEELDALWEEIKREVP